MASPRSVSLQPLQQSDPLLSTLRPEQTLPGEEYPVEGACGLHHVPECLAREASQMHPSTQCAASAPAEKEEEVTADQKAPGQRN